MFFVFVCCVQFLLPFLLSNADDQCRQLEFRPEQTFMGKRLVNHVIRCRDVTTAGFCDVLCHTEHNCASVNLMNRSDAEGYKCELNNATHEGNEHSLEDNPNYFYRGTKSACVSNPCLNNATCQTGFTDKGYRCLCTPGFHGHECQKELGECELGKPNCSADAVCVNTKESYNCSCKPGYIGDGWNCEAQQCNETILSDERNHPCSLAVCGVGQWKLVMKIDGTKNNFHYGSSLWSNKATFNPLGGETVFDTQEMKLKTYWNTPFSKICLGMKIHGEENINFLVINKTADSLYSLIADGQYRATSLGRDTWKTLIGPDASLQIECNKEGFNVVGFPRFSKARIGILGNNEQFTCNSCDSRIGFGTGGDPDDFNTCGNEASWYPDNGEKHIKAMGYILVN